MTSPSPLPNTRRRAQSDQTRPRSSLERMIGILDLFQGRTLRWTFDAMAQHLGYPRSTLYRYLGILLDAGLLSSQPSIGFTLGPRIIQLDYELRASDPLIANGRLLLQTLVKESDGFGLLCRHYRGQVLCVHQEAGASLISSGYERGRAMPMLRGATSRVILAHLRPTLLAELGDQLRSELTANGDGRTWQQLEDELRSIRVAGYCVSRGEVTPGVTGIAAPVFDSADHVIGSLTLTTRGSEANSRVEQTMIDRVIFGARLLTHSMRSGTDPRE